MNFKPYLDTFLEMEGIDFVGIIDNVLNSNYKFETNFEDDSLLSELHSTLSTELFELSIEKFLFKRANQTIYGIVENDVLLVLVFKNDCDLSEINAQIDKFLNDVLINS